MKKREDNNLYEKKITLGRDPDGKIVRRSIYAKTKGELEKKAFDAKQEFLLESARPSNDMSFATFARNWIKTEKAGRGIRTVEMYNLVIEKYLVPAIGDLYFSEITQADLVEILQMYFSKYETCNKIKLTLRQIYAAAQDAQMPIDPLVRPSRLVLPPKPQSGKRALTDAEKDAIFTADLSDKERAFVLMLYYTGMRKEEALALTDADVDLKNRIVHVSKVRIWDKTNNQTIIKQGAKNHYSVRDIPLPEQCIDFFRHYMKGLKGYLFGMERKDYDVMTETSFRWMWYHIQKKLALVSPEAANLTPHLFRHNYATLLYYSNISPKMAAKLMGHADTTMIMRIYAHLDEEKENTTEKVNSMFCRNAVVQN